MKSASVSSRQAGATLVVGMVMLAMLTLMILSAATMSTGNLKVVNNLQFRDEAIASTNFAIERFITDAFPANMIAEPAGDTIEVDVDGGDPDYAVVIETPACLFERPVPTSDLDAENPNDAACFVGASLTPTLGGSGGTTSFCSATQWEIRATATPVVDTGARVVIRQGLSKRMATQAASNACE